jgi:hypothetical protein
MLAEDTQHFRTTKVSWPRTGGADQFLRDNDRNRQYAEASVPVLAGNGWTPISREWKVTE